VIAITKAIGGYKNKIKLSTLEFLKLTHFIRKCLLISKLSWV